jgi:hypothetical protein
MLIPPNITRTDFRKMKALNLPETILTRIWHTKILWLICMHKDDVLKVSLCAISIQLNACH